MLHNSPHLRQFPTAPSPANPQAFSRSRCGGPRPPPAQTPNPYPPNLLFAFPFLARCPGTSSHPTARQLRMDLAPYLQRACGMAKAWERRKGVTGDCAGTLRHATGMRLCRQSPGLPHQPDDGGGWRSEDHLHGLFPKVGYSVLQVKGQETKSSSPKRVGEVH